MLYYKMYFFLHVPVQRLKYETKGVGTTMAIDN